MSIRLHNIVNRSSSGGPRWQKIDDENTTQDTAGLTTDATKTAKATKQQSFFTRIFSDTWTLEILCWLLALVSLVIIIIVLAIYNGRSFENWHSGLTLNTLISIASQIAQTAVFVPVAASISQLKWIWYSKSRPVAGIGDFDKASRGPIDSLLLIAKHPTWILVYLGALNTSLVLLLGSFAQQSVSLPLRPRNSTSSSGWAPITRQYQAYLASETLPTPQGPTGSIVFSTVPPLMAAAVTDALFANEIDPSAVAAECTTGNCTFPDYTSLAVCSAAEDVSPKIINRCPHIFDVTHWEGECYFTLSPLQIAPTARADNFTTMKDGIPALWIGASENQGLNASRSKDLVKAGANPANLVEFYILFFPDMRVFSTNHKTDPSTSVVALQITLSLCLKTYNTTVTNGRTTTTIANTPRALEFHEKTLSQAPNPTTVISTTDTDGMEYWMESLTANAFNSFLAIATFYGTYINGTPSHPNVDHDATSDAARAFGDIFYNNAPSDHVAAIRPLLANLETSMSNAMRNTSIIPSKALGTATYDEVFISVDFRWLTVPILSIILSLLFLVLVMVETRRKEVPVWKDELDKALLAVEPETRARMEGLMGASNGGAGSGERQMGEVPVVVEKEGKRGWWLRGPDEEWWASRRKGGGD